MKVPEGADAAVEAAVPSVVNTAATDEKKDAPEDSAMGPKEADAAGEPAAKKQKDNVEESD